MESVVSGEEAGAVQAHPVGGDRSRAARAGRATAAFTDQSPLGRKRLREWRAVLRRASGTPERDHTASIIGLQQSSEILTCLEGYRVIWWSIVGGGAKCVRSRRRSRASQQRRPWYGCVPGPVNAARIYFDVEVLTRLAGSVVPVSATMPWPPRNLLPAFPPPPDAARAERSRIRR